MKDPERLIRDDARRRYGDPPNPAATWARLAPRLIPRERHVPRRRHPLYRTAPVATLGALLIVGAFLLAGVATGGARPAPVGAAEILARAGRAVGPGGPTTVRGYRGTIVGQARDAHDAYQTTTYDPATAPLVSDTATIWFRAPGSWWAENRRVVGRWAALEVHRSISDGTACWFEDSARQEATRADAALCDPSVLLGPADPTGLAGADGRGYAARLGADAAIAGRPAYTIVVTLDPLPVPTTGLAPLLTYPSTATDTIVRTLWIDRETYLVLGVEDRDPRGTLLTGWAYTEFALDPPTDPARFTYTPPPGYAVIDQRRPATPTPTRPSTPNTRPNRTWTNGRAQAGRDIPTNSWTPPLVACG